MLLQTESILEIILGIYDPLTLKKRRYENRGYSKTNLLCEKFTR